MKRNIVLIGAMGSGKSHLGRNLADALGWQFVDTDRLLERRYRQPIAELYERLGAKAFREAEIEILKQVSLYHEAVISLGGNHPLEHRYFNLLQKYSYIVGIRAAKFQIVRRVSRRIGKRPTMDYNDIGGTVDSMMADWRSVYRRCDYVLDTTRGMTQEFILRICEDIQSKNISFKKRKDISREKDHEEDRTVD